MIKQQEQRKIILLGEAGTETAEQACRHAEQQGLLCQVLSWKELRECNPAMLQQQRTLPILLGEWLTPDILRQTMRGGAQLGLCIIPLGKDEAWEAAVPLENSEWVSIKVGSPDGEWVKAFEQQSPEGEQEESDTYILNGTHVSRETVTLTHPLVNLNEEVAASAPPVLTTTTHAKQKKTHKTSSSRRMLKAVTLILLLFILFIGTVVSLHLYSQARNRHQEPPISMELNQAESANSAQTNQPMTEEQTQEITATPTNENEVSAAPNNGETSPEAPIDTGSENTGQDTVHQDEAAPATTFTETETTSTADESSISGTTSPTAEDKNTPLAGENNQQKTDTAQNEGKTTESSFSEKHTELYTHKSAETKSKPSAFNYKIGALWDERPPQTQSAKPSSSGSTKTTRTPNRTTEVNSGTNSSTINQKTSNKQSSVSTKPQENNTATPAQKRTSGETCDICRKYADGKEFRSHPTKVAQQLKSTSCKGCKTLLKTFLDRLQPS